MTFAWKINADPGFDPKAITDLNAALQEWSSQIDGKGTLVVALKLAPTSVGRATGGSTTNMNTGMVDASNNNDPILEDSGVYKLLTGNSEPGATSDITITVDPNYLATLYLDPDPGHTTIPANQIDLTQVFAHEVGHGLGMDGFISLGGTRGQVETGYDTKVAFTNGKPYFTGSNAEKAYGGPVPLTFGGPNNLSNYSQNIYHLSNNNSDPVVGNDLMTGAYFPFGNLQVSALDVAIVRDVLAAANASVTISDKTTNPVIVRSGKTATPFTNVTVADPVLGDAETISISLTGYSYPGTAGIGAISDPSGGGSFNAATGMFTETALNTGSPTAASTILGRLIYTPPALSNGATGNVRASIAVNGVADPTAVQIDTATAPAITGTAANEPVASGDTIRPFASAQLADGNYFGVVNSLTAAITMTDGGAASDADGLLAGAGLSKTGAGAYAISAGDSYTLQSYLRGVVFTPVAVAAGATRTTAFGLNVTDALAGLSTNDATTSVLVIGPAVAPAPPLIAGTLANQTVAPGNAIMPLSGVTVSDTNPNPADSATLTLTGGGSLSGAGLVAGAAGVYTIAATTPAALTAILDKLIYTAPGANTGQASTIKLDVVDGAQAASDSTTSIIETTPKLPNASNFTIADQATGQQTAINGVPYVGPVAGLDLELIEVTPDNLNITANVPNVFIHSGAGMDALDVSKANGNNILDGSTGSNFLTGGTGADTFYLDNRNPLADVFSTLVNFHSGDNASVFGVNATDFTLTTLDGQGAATAKGLDFAFAAPGHANANIVLAGFSKADLGNGRLTVTYGATPDIPGVPGSQYMNVHAN